MPQNAFQMAKSKYNHKNLYDYKYGVCRNGPTGTDETGRIGENEMTYFKNIKSFEDLKSQYKALLKSNHPDNGGDVEAMKDINVQFDALFQIWKGRKEAQTGATVNETADGTRSQFYTEFGWEGNRHDWNRSLKEIAQIVRAYVKEKYPTYKFSVRTSYASMCQELHVSLKEAPGNIYKESPAELTEDERNKLWRSLYYNNIFIKDCWTDAELDEAIMTAWAQNDCYKVYNDATAAMLTDIDSFVKSYNYEDCDGMIDYFNVDFYYFGCRPDDLKIVPKTARIKNKTAKPAKADNSTPEPGKNEKSENTALLGHASGYIYKITKGEDTRDGSDLWLVRIAETLDRAEFIAENKVMNERGGYYSKFRKAFIFRFDPTDILTGKKAA